MFVHHPRAPTFCFWRPISATPSYLILFRLSCSLVIFPQDPSITLQLETLFGAAKKAKLESNFQRPAFYRELIFYFSRSNEPGGNERNKKTKGSKNFARRLVDNGGEFIPRMGLPLNSSNARVRGAGSFSGLRTPRFSFVPLKSATWFGTGSKMHRLQSLC